MLGVIAMATAYGADPLVERAIEDAQKKYPAGDYPSLRSAKPPDSFRVQIAETEILQKTREFVRRNNPTFDFSKHRLVTTGPIVSREGSKSVTGGYIVSIKEHKADGTEGRTVAEVYFDALGTLVKIEWFNQPETR